MLEQYSIKYSNSFYQFLKEAINLSNDLQRQNFNFLISKLFFENLDELFRTEIQLKEIKENEKLQNSYNNFLNRIENEFIPELERIINNKIEIITNLKNEVELFSIKLINEEKKNSKIKIKEAEKELEQRIKEKNQEIKGAFDNEEKSILKSELKAIKNENVFEIAFRKIIKRIDEEINKAFIKLKQEMELMKKEIEIKIEEKKKFILQDENLNELPKEDKEQFLLFLKQNTSFFYNFASAIQTSIIATFGSIFRGVVVGFAASALLGGTIGTTFGIPGMFIGAGIGLLSGAISLLIHNIRKGAKYENVLSKINDLVCGKIEGKFDDIISSLENYKEDIKKTLKIKLEVEKNKIKNINFEDFKNEYINEKNEIMIKLKELL